jgi:Tol biopolymer transport system component
MPRFIADGLIQPPARFFAARSSILAYRLDKLSALQFPDKTQMIRVLFPMRRLISILLLLCAACNYPTAALITPSVTAQPLATEAPTATTSPALLPHSVYFLSQRSGSTQVWRLETDGATLVQLTNEATNVDGYDVSPQDGSIAYVLENQIYLMNADGSDRRLLVDNAAADSNAEDFFHTRLVSAPSFSPDGSKLAYGVNGIWIYDLATSRVEHALENQVEDGLMLYSPLVWAPDNQQLLISIAAESSSTLAVWQVGKELVTLESEDQPCCQYIWAPDSRSILLASATLGLVEPGLWRYDTRTGQRSTLIETSSGDTYNFVGWPLQLTNGDLQYFYSSAAEVPEGDVPLYIIRSAADGTSSRTQLRSESFSLREALWAPAGDLVLVAQPAAGGDGNSGPVAVVQLDGSPVLPLIDSAFDLRWGP